MNEDEENLPQEDESWRDVVVTAGELYDLVRGITTLPGRFALAERFKERIQANLKKQGEK